MSTRVPMTAPGYDVNGRWHGPASAEVEYWKARALKAESAVPPPKVLLNQERRG